MDSVFVLISTVIHQFISTANCWSFSDVLSSLRRKQSGLQLQREALLCDHSRQPNQLQVLSISEMSSSWNASKRSFAIVHYVTHHFTSSWCNNTSTTSAFNAIQCNVMQCQLMRWCNVLWSSGMWSMDYNVMPCSDPLQWMLYNVMQYNALWSKVSIVA